MYAQCLTLPPLPSQRQRGFDETFHGLSITPPMDQIGFLFVSETSGVTPQEPSKTPGGRKGEEEPDTVASIEALGRGMQISALGGSFKKAVAPALTTKAPTSPNGRDGTQEQPYRTTKPWLTAMVFHAFTQLAFVLAVLCIGAVRGALIDLPSGRPHCHSPLRRQEWRQLSIRERKDYIGAVRCLQSKSARMGFSAAKTLFDDFQALHISLTPEVHVVGQFLPWHRLFVWTYEAALRQKCGYQGAQPYWDWTLDSSSPDSFANSPIFDPSVGFGSAQGTGPNGTVLNGPFSNYTLAYGIGPIINKHALRRRNHFEFLQYLTQDQVDNTTKQTNFEDFRIELEGKPITELVKIHDGGHRLMGGDMANTYSSPGDPLFYLHHANLDRIWLGWQKDDPDTRMYQVSGRTRTTPPYGNLTLKFMLKMNNLGPSRPVRDVMDAENGVLCYGYDDDGSGR